MTEAGVQISADVQALFGGLVRVVLTELAFHGLLDVLVALKEERAADRAELGDDRSDNGEVGNGHIQRVHLDGFLAGADVAKLGGGVDLDLNGAVGGFLDNLGHFLEGKVVGGGGVVAVAELQNNGLDGAVGAGGRAGLGGGGRRGFRAGAAGSQTENHDQRQDESKDLLHFGSSIMIFYLLLCKQ